MLRNLEFSGTSSPAEHVLNQLFAAPRPTTPATPTAAADRAQNWGVGQEFRTARSPDGIDTIFSLRIGSERGVRHRHSQDALVFELHANPEMLDVAGLKLARRDDAPGLQGYRCRVEVFDLDAVTFDEATLLLVPFEVRQKFGVLPLQLTLTGLRVAMVDPSDFTVLDELRFITGRVIEGVAANEDAIARALKRTGPVGDLAAYFRVTPDDARLIDNALVAMLFRAAWLEARFITVDDSGASVWADQQWKREVDVEPAVREALARALRTKAHVYGTLKDSLGSFAMVIPPCGVRGFMFRIDPDRLLIEHVSVEELDQRVAAGRFEPESPPAHPYR